MADLNPAILQQIAQAAQAQQPVPPKAKQKGKKKQTPAQILYPNMNQPLGGQ